MLEGALIVFAAIAVWAGYNAWRDHVAALSPGKGAERTVGDARVRTLRRLGRIVLWVVAPALCAVIALFLLLLELE